MRLTTITLFLVILVVNVRCQCPTSCASIIEAGVHKYCPADSRYRCIDVSCDRVKEYCFCVGNRKYAIYRNECIGINECDTAELENICTSDRPPGPGLCGELDACTLSNIDCSNPSKPICGGAICQDLAYGHECYCLGKDILVNTTDGLDCVKPVCKNDTDSFYNFKVEWAEGNYDETSYIDCENIDPMFIGVATRKCTRNLVWDKPDYTQCIRSIFNILLGNHTIIGLQKNLNNVTREGTSNSSLLYSGEFIIVNRALEKLIDKYVDIQEDSRIFSEAENVATIETPEIAVRAGSYMLSGVNRETWELVGNTTTLVSFVDRFERFSLAINNSNNTVHSENLELKYTRVDTSSRVEIKSGDEKGNDASMNVVIREDLVKLLNQSCNETSFSSIRFRTISELIPVVLLHDPHTDTESNTTLISDVYSLNTKQCMNTTIVVPEESVKIEFLFRKPTQVNNTETGYICAFWNLTTNSWSTQGVKTTVQQQQHDGTVKITCTPTHLTSFAILLSSYTPTETDNTIQTILSVITCSLSVACLVGSLLCYLILYIRTRKSVKNPFKPDSILIIHINFCMALLLATLTFLISEPATWNRIPCTIVAGLQHYLWLSVFSWSLCEGIVIVWKIRFWDKSQVLWPVLVPIGWGLPIPIVVITIPITYSYYVDLNIGCWVNNFNNLKLISFVLPILMTIPTNILFYCYTLVKIYRLKDRLEDSKKQVRSIIVGSLVLLPLLGIPWVIGVFYVSKETAIFGYIFIILVGCQGVFFFIAHVARNAMIQEYVFKWKSLYGEHAHTSNKFVKLHSLSFQTSVQGRSSVDNGEADK